MATEWRIKGQAGKAVDNSLHTLESLQAEGAEVEFRTLDSDTLSWTANLRSMVEASAKVPELGQQITLFRNNVRYFTGTVTKRRLKVDGQGSRVEIGVEGPWWYLKQIFLSSEIPDQTGTAKERGAYILPTASPRTHLISLVTRAIYLGAPISMGTFASCYDIPRLSLRNIPLSEAFAEVMRWVADGHIYIDYQTAPSEFPALCMQRRAAAALYTLTPAAGVVSNIDLQPRLDLQVDQVHVMYAKRKTLDNKRVTSWESYSAGTAVSGMPRRQPVLTSGPELDTFLPPSFTDSVVVKSSPLLYQGQLTSGVFAKYDSRLKSANAGPFQLAPMTVMPYNGPPWTLPAVSTRIVDKDGDPISAAFAYYLSVGEIKDWFTADGIKSIVAKMSATLYDGPYTWQGIDNSEPEPPPPGWYATLGGQIYTYDTLKAGIIQFNKIYAITSSVDVPLVTKLWAGKTTLIRKEDYNFVNPPADLAQNLLESQNWLPYQGTVSYISEAIPAAHAVGGVLNISGLIPETTNMRAMIAAHRVRLTTGETTYTLGSPGRLSYRDLVNRFRQNGADNVVMLRDYTSGDAGQNPPPDPALEIPIIPTGSILDETGTEYEMNEDGNTYPTTEDS